MAAVRGAVAMGRAVVDAFHEAVAGLAAARGACCGRAGGPGSGARAGAGKAGERHGVLGREWLACWLRLLAEDGVEGVAHGVEVRAHGGAGVRGDRRLRWRARMRWCSLSEACWRSATMFRVSDWWARASRMSATTLSKTLLPLARAMAAWKLESRATQASGSVFGGHGGHDVPEGVQFLGGAALRRPGRRRELRCAGRASVRSRAEYWPSDQVVGHLVGHDERAPAGLGDGQAEGGAGAEGLADHRAAHAVLLGEGGLGAELCAHGHAAGFDVRRGWR